MKEYKIKMNNKCSIKKTKVQKEQEFNIDKIHSRKNSNNSNNNEIINNEENIEKLFLGKKREKSTIQINEENQPKKLIKMKNKTNHKKILADTNSYDLVHLENFLHENNNIFSFYVIIIDEIVAKFGFICYFSIDYPIFFFAYSKKEKIKKPYKILKINKVKISEKQLLNIEKFNLKISREIFPSDNNKILKESEKDDSYHLSVPIIIDPSTNIPNIDFDIIEKFIDPHLDNKKINLDDMKNNNKLIYNKTNQELLEYINHFDKDDSFDKFIKILCENNEKFINKVIEKEFTVEENNKTLNEKKKVRNLNGKFIDYLNKKIPHNCSAISRLSNYLTYKANKKLINKIVYLTVFSGKKNEIVLYNKDKDENKQKQTLPKEKEKYIQTLYPEDELIYFFYSREDIEQYIQIPKLFVFFIRFLYPYELVKRINMEKNLNKYNNSYQYFIYACTPPSCGLFFSYETLETLGDTILKFFITSEIVFNIYQEEKRHKIGDLEKLRVSYINNKYLSEKGRGLKIGNYIISQYSVDLFKQIKFEISDKQIADILESLIAACYLSRNNLIDSLNFIQKSKVWEKFSESTLKRCNVEYSSFDFKEYIISKGKIPLKNITFLEGVNFLKKESEYITIEKIKNYYEIHKDYVNFPELNKRYKSLEKCVGYQFKNKQILRNAFSSASHDEKNNYEKLELLGDSIVEIYIELFLYKIFSPLIYENNNYQAYKLNLFNQAKKFNNSTVTKIKSFLCSNNFMCKLSYIWTLPLYFKFTGEKIGKNFEKFLSEENIKKMLNRKFIEYENPTCEFPKFIADIFEAFIGAIYTDSNLENCFLLLNKIYFPFLLYFVYYFDEVKISSVNDFSDLCGEIKQMPNFFYSKDENGINIVQIKLNDKVLCEGRGLTTDEAKQKAAQTGIQMMKNNWGMKD